MNQFTLIALFKIKLGYWYSILLLGEKIIGGGGPYQSFDELAGVVRTEIITVSKHNPVAVISMVPSSNKNGNILSPSEVESVMKLLW